MSKQFKPGRTIVATPQPSRIRKEAPRIEHEAWWRSREWETRLSVAGVILFAIAITLLSVGIAEVTSY